jgi:fructose-specific phosphotransferase system component IIB
MNLDKKILEELRRFNQINSYILNEQDVPPPPPADAGAVPPAPEDVPAADAGAVPPADDAGAVPPADAAAPEAGGEAIPEPVDIENDPDVEEVGTEGEGDAEGEAEEIDITDLVTSQQEIQAKQDEFMDGIFTKLDDLEKKLSHMDQIMDKINSLETKFDKYREKTPEEKLMLRSLDSYPYNQKLTDFFDDKKDEMEETGKNEYVLTSDDVENFSPNEVKKTFNIYDENDNAL